jgi:hypothetical protein
MPRIMLLIYLVLAFVSLDAQNKTNEISYTGVYKGSPLFVQNPYLPNQKKYCIKNIIVNEKSLKLDYARSALMLTFESIDKYAPVTIHIEYSDSTCVPVFLNPDAIAYHNVFRFDFIGISDSSIYWTSRGEESFGRYEVEAFDLGYWEVVKTLPSEGIYGGASYEYFPNYEEGVNKFRIKYSYDNFILYSEEVEHVFYPEPITFKRVENTLVLSRAAVYVMYDKDNMEVLSGNAKEIDISSIPSGEYGILFEEKQYELFRKNDQVTVIKKPKSNN